MSIYGSARVAYLEHEVENWIRSRVRADTGERVAAPVTSPPLEQMRFITVAETVRRIGFTREHLWRLEKAGKFPRRVRVGTEPATPAPRPRRKAAAEAVA
jgi:predicted DNA-binding transcriptional regulator AlpA